MRCGIHRHQELVIDSIDNVVVKPCPLCMKDAKKKGFAAVYKDWGKATQWCDATESEQAWKDRMKEKEDAYRVGLDEGRKILKWLLSESVLEVTTKPTKKGIEIRARLL